MRRDAACRVYGLGASLCCAQGDGMGAPSRILVQLPPPASPPPPSARGAGGAAAAVDDQPWVGGRFAWSGAHVASLSTAATVGGHGAAALSRLLEPLRRCLQPSPLLPPAPAAMGAAASGADGAQAPAPGPSSVLADEQPQPPLDGSRPGLAWYALALLAGGLALVYRQAR